MRLLNVRELSFKLFTKSYPGYAILSHRWTDNESLLHDIEQGSLSPKVRGFVDYVKSHLQLEWIWVDSCCIDQKSAAELSEGVNCMFEWYRNANVCIAYLADVKHPSDQVAFRKTVWFTRGWTLQELVASTVVLFVSETWEVIGHKGRVDHLADLEVGSNLESIIAEITGVPIAVLQDSSKSHALSVEQRMHWMDGRETLKEEDLSYALFGIFGVTPGANYGEKKVGAVQRLKRAIAEKEHDLPMGALALSPVMPQHHIPFIRDPAFVEREAMSVIKEKFRRPGARVAIAGLGGIGKSQLAIEHCYRTMADSTNTWVLWLHASSPTRFDQEVYGLVEDLKIPGWQDKDAQVFQLFRGWLNDSSRRWLIVLDNADDADFLFEAPESGNRRAKTRIDFVPVCSHGSMLVTTRRQAMAKRLVDDTITLDPEQPLAIELLRTKLGMLKETAELARLAAALDAIPLAVAQAAAYIKQREPRYTVEDYLAKLEKSEKLKSSLLKTKSHELRRDRREAENSILLTWQISFEHLRSTRQSAADLLSLMSFYDHQGIPDCLIRHGIDAERDAESDGASEADAEEAFEEDITTLRDYSFVSVAPSGSVLQMHRLVQFAAQVWLRERTDQFDRYQAQSLRNLSDQYPHPDFEQWKQCQTLQTHVKHISKVEVKNNDAALTLASIMYRAAWYEEDQGHYAEAEVMSTCSLHINKNILGADHSDTLDNMNNLALTYHFQGRYGESERLRLEQMKAITKVKGEEDPHTLMSMSNLALTYFAQGRLGEAEELNLKVIESRKRVLGEQHPDTLMTMSNLALTYLDQRRYGESEELHLKVIERRKRVLGEEHPDTLTTMSNLAWLYYCQRQLGEAEELNLHVLERRKRVLAEAHPDTLMTMSNLALTYLDQGRLGEAEELNLNVKEGRKRVLGEEHPDTLMSMSNLALTYLDQGRYGEAEELEGQVLEMRKRVLGGEHLDTLTSMSDLALTYEKQNRYQEAEELGLMVVEMRKNILGDEHPATLTSMSNLALTYAGQKRFQEAEKLGLRVFEMRTKILGDEHPATLTSMSNLALTYDGQNRYQKAEELGLRVIDMRTKILRDEHPDTLRSMSNLVVTYYWQKRYQEAEELASRVVEMQKRVLGDTHPETLMSMHNLAITLFLTDKGQEACKLMTTCLHSRIAILGDRHPNTLESASNLKVMEERLLTRTPQCLVPIVPSRTTSEGEN